MEAEPLHGIRMVDFLTLEIEITRMIILSADPVKPHYPNPAARRTLA